ncbi:MAG: hypothetical protein ACRDH5_16685, partial [bacterium]
MGFDRRAAAREGRRGSCSRLSAASVPTLLLAATALCLADFRLTDPSSRIYYQYAMVAGERLQVQGSTEIAGNLHANGDVHLLQGSAVTGDVSAAGTVTRQGTVTGTVREGTAPLTRPVLASAEELRQTADRVLAGDTELVDAVLDDVLFVDGDVRVRGTLRGVGTLISTGDIRLEPGSGAAPPPDPASRLSLIALQDIRIDQDRAFRGVLYARRDVALQKGLRMAGVAIAGRNLTLDKDSRLDFVDFDTIPPLVTLVRPPHGALLATAAPTLEVSYSDELSALDLATVRLLLD